METSSGMHSGKGKLAKGKGSVGRGKLSASKSRESGWKNRPLATQSSGGHKTSAALSSAEEHEHSNEERDGGDVATGKDSVGRGKLNASKSRESGRKSRPLATQSSGGHKTSAALPSAEEDEHSNEEGDGGDKERDGGDEEKQSTHLSDMDGKRKRPAAKLKKGKVCETAEDVEIEISNLKPPPRKLTREDFAKEYNLCNESAQNPHRYRKGSLPTKLVRKYFGDPVGEGGRNGFSWQQCEQTDLKARIQELHPILYQHGAGEVPGLLKVHFAEGVAMEYEKGAKEVNWCLFGEETNKRQRNRYEQDLEKLQAFKNTLQDFSKSVQMRGRQWRSIKIDPGQKGVRLEPDRKGVKLEGGWESGKTDLVERVPVSSRSKLGETGGESGMSADCEGGDFQRGGGTLSKAGSAERLVEVESLMSVVHMEGEVLKIELKETESNLEKCQWKRREKECLVGTFQGQMEVKSKLIEDMKGTGADVARELIKLEMVQEQLAFEEQNVVEANIQLQQAETALAIVQHKIVCHRLEFDALLAQSWSLKRGRVGISFLPRPMVYASTEENTSELTSFDSESTFIGVTVCCLCSFPFPHSDIVISSCRHMYHPFCASVLFSNSQICVAMGCKSLAHPEWHRSFGWGEPSPDLVQRALMLGLAEERKKILQDRLDAAKAKCPHAASGQGFARPANSPANFTEGATSQAICSPKATDWGRPTMSTIEEDIHAQQAIDPIEKKRSRGEVDSPAVKAKLRKKKKITKVFNENDMDEELEFCSETESSEDGLARKVLNLPSSSGTTISTDGDDLRIEGNAGEMDIDDGNDFLKSPLRSSLDTILVTPPKTQLSRLVRGPRDDETSQGEAQEANPLGEIRGASQKENEAVPGDAWEEMDADHADVDDGEPAESQAEIKGAVPAVPEATMASNHRGSNSEPNDSVTAGVGEVMGVPEVVLGEGKCNAEGDVRDTTGFDEGNVKNGRNFDEGDVGVEMAVDEGDDGKGNGFDEGNVGEKMAEDEGDVGEGNGSNEGKVGERMASNEGDSSEGKDEGGKDGEMGKSSDEGLGEVIVQEEELAGSKGKKEKLMEVQPQAGSDESKQKVEEMASKTVAVKKSKKKKRDQKEGKKNRKEVDHAEAQTSPENLKSSEHSFFTELKKIADGGGDGGGEEVAPITDPTPILSPPGRRNTRSQQGNLTLSTQAGFLYNTEDLSHGLEARPIPVAPHDSPMRSFKYMTTSVVHKNAQVNTSIVGLEIGEFCACRRDDCLTAVVPCQCTKGTGGEFAYNPGGLLKDHFLQNGGHMCRTFIRECNFKCGCHSKCGNRVVQQGMKYSVEVYHTAHMGWGIRAAESIPKGAYVFEMIGEILTNAEMLIRNLVVDGGPSYALQLDADRSTERKSNDNTALCLDATHFGNVARFLNHRCGDANLIDIPVKIEGSGKSFYHVAFFTKRQIKAQERLTWDYGIDFSNCDPELPSFACKCGSIMCRDKISKGI